MTARAAGPSPLLVDGPRPAVEWASHAVHRYRLKPDEAHVLLVLAIDAFDGETTAASWDELCAWTGMFKGRVVAAMAGLTEATEDRPALVELAGYRDRRRVRRLAIAETGRGRGARPGDPVGDVVGDPVGDVVGDPVGDVVGDPVGDVVGEPDRTLPFPSLPTPLPPAAGDQPDDGRVRGDGEGFELEQESWPPPAAPAHPDDVGTADATSYRHPFEANTRATLSLGGQRAWLGRVLPIDELVGHAYALGQGDPWEGVKALEVLARGVKTAQDPAAALRARLRKAAAA